MSLGEVIKTNSDTFFCPVLYQDLWSKYTSILVQVEVKWLSHGKVLTHFSKLCVETEATLTLKEQKYTKVLADNEWVDKLTYMSHSLNNLIELGKGPVNPTYLPYYQTICCFVLQKKCSQSRSRNYNGTHMHYEGLSLHNYG
jgi:hypothetical protein